jgi:hypothetical protein
MDSDPQDHSRSWTTRKDEKARRLAKVKHWTDGHLLDPDRIVDAFENLFAPGDRVALEGNNQKQADFLQNSKAGSLCRNSCPDLLPVIHASQNATTNRGLIFSLASQ